MKKIDKIYFDDVIETSKSDSKKFIAIFTIVYTDGSEKEKKVKFGAKGYSDYTIHKDRERRERYRQRHKFDNLNKYDSPGALSYYLLWGRYTNMRSNIPGYKKKFNLK